KMWRHHLGTSAAGDELIYEEKDTTFMLFLEKSQSGKYIFVQSISTMTREIQLIDADAPLEAPKLVDGRREGVEYDVEHWGNALYILTNEGALNFKLLRAPFDDLHNREMVIEHHEDRYLQIMYPFRESLFIMGRENGLTQIWKLHDGG